MTDLNQHKLLQIELIKTRRLLRSLINAVTAFDKKQNSMVRTVYYDSWRRVVRLAGEIEEYLNGNADKEYTSCNVKQD